jgi:hypothetical protein
MATWDQTTLDKIVSPPEVTAAAVSSQEVSIPRIILCLLINAVFVNFVQYQVQAIVQKNWKYDMRCNLFKPSGATLRWPQNTNNMKSPKSEI